MVEKSETADDDSREDTLADLDSLTLTEYDHRLDVEISMLIDPEVSTEAFVDNFERWLDDQLTCFPHTTNCEVTEYGGESEK